MFILGTLRGKLTNSVFVTYDTYIVNNYYMTAKFLLKESYNLLFYFNGIRFICIAFVEL